MLYIKKEKLRSCAFGPNIFIFLCVLLVYFLKPYFYIDKVHTQRFYFKQV